MIPDQPTGPKHRLPSFESPGQVGKIRGMQRPKFLRWLTPRFSLRILFIAAILPMVGARLFGCQPVWAATAAQINADLSHANEPYTITGNHELDAPIRPESGKTFICTDAVLETPDGANYPAIQCSRIKNATINLGSIEHGGAPTGNGSIIIVEYCEDITVNGGKLHGGYSAVFCRDSKRVRFNNVETSGCRVGNGWEFWQCDGVRWNNCTANGHKGDGVRFLCNNKNLRLNGGEIDRNGSRLGSADQGFIGTGLHLGQSENVFVGGRLRVTNNLGGGVIWKSSFAPDSIATGAIPNGTPRNFEIDGLIMDGNGYGNLAIVWNASTKGTVRPHGFKARDVVSRNSRDNGLILDCDELGVVTHCVFESDKTAVGVVYSKGQNVPTWRPIDSTYLRVGAEVNYYPADRR
jgi:hypothetical protein